MGKRFIFSDLVDIFMFDTTVKLMLTLEMYDKGF
jgi:hypothetical protein